MILLLSAFRPVISPIKRLPYLFDQEAKPAPVFTLRKRYLDNVFLFLFFSLSLSLSLFAESDVSAILALLLILRRKIYPLLLVA